MSRRLVAVELEGRPSPPPRPRPPQDPRSGTADRLVAAAAEVFLSLGYEHARAEDVARRAGTTTDAINAIFAGEAGLLAAVLSVRGDDVLAPVLDAIGTERPVTYGVMAVARGKDRRATSCLCLLADACATARREEHVAEALRPVLERLEAELLARISHGRAWGVLEPQSSAPELASSALALLIGAATLRSVDVEPAGPAPDRA